jgi:GNAT superfamily N-acetyltransferase
VCEIDNQGVGFAIADLKGNNIWALFLDPKFEKKGIGRVLYKTMLDLFFYSDKSQNLVRNGF